MYSAGLGFDSDRDFKDFMYLREINPMVNNLEEASQILKLYPANPQGALSRLNNLLRFLPAENRG